MGLSNWDTWFNGIRFSCQNFFYTYNSESRSAIYALSFEYHMNLLSDEKCIWF